jgi:hypothetical protein
MKKPFAFAVLATALFFALCPGPALAWWPTYGGWGGGFWPDTMWPYSGSTGRESYRAQADALRSAGIQRADQQAAQLRGDQQAEAARRGADMQQWASVARRQQNLQAQVDSSRKFEEMKTEYYAELNRPRSADEEAKRAKAWVESIRRQVRVAYADIFTTSWMAEHPIPGAGVQFRNPNPYHWWNTSTWAAITGWVIGSWGEPVPYNFGKNVVVKNGVVYIDGKEVAGAADFAANAIAIAAAGVQAMSAPPAQREKMEWQPLGVFALSHEAKGTPTMFVQLAVDKNGIIAGTYFNSSTETTQAVQGAVERTSARAAWSVADHKDTVLEAGVLNLTQDELPVLVHFGTDQSQRWLLTRMFPPKGRQVP